MYLEQRAAEDALFAKNYRNPAKNIDDCVTYILNYVQKKYLVSNIMMTDAGMLVRAVGNGEQFPAERKKAAANMEP